MVLNTNPNSRISLKEIFSLSIIFTIMLAITSINLVFSNTFGETCGFLHPYIFEAQVSMIDPGGGLNWNSDLTTLPHNESDVRLLDTYLRVYDEEGKLLSSDDDTIDGDRSSGSSIEEFPATESGLVLVEVGSYSDTGSGFYEIEVTSSEVTQAGAEVLRLGSSATGVIFSGEENRLSYNLELEAGAEVIIRLSGLAEDGFELDTYLRLYDQEENLLAENDDFGSLSSGLIFTNSSESTQSYVLGVGTYNDSYSGRFEIEIAPYVLNTIQGDAMQVGQAVHGDFAALQRYRHEIALDAGEKVLLIASGLDADEYALALNLQAFDENEASVAQSYSMYPATLIVSNTGESSATYTIEVSTYGDSLSGSYELSVRPYVIDIVEGYDIEVGDSVAGDIEMLQRARHRLSAEANTRTLISVGLVDSTDYPIPASVSIYHENGELLQTYPPDYPAEFYSETGGSYIIEIGSPDDAVAGSYDVTFNSVRISQGEALRFDSPISGTSTSDEVMRYPLSLDAGQSISIYTTDTIAGREDDAIFVIYDPNGNYLTSAYAESGTKLINFSLPEAGTIFIEVWSREETEASFTFVVEAFELETLAGEPVSIGQTIAATIEPGQRIRYPISIEAGRPLSLFVQGVDLENYPLPVWMWIYDAEGNEIAMNDFLSHGNSLGAGFSNYDYGDASNLVLEIGTYNDSIGGEFSLYIVESFDEIPSDAGEQYLDIVENDAILIGDTVTGTIESNQTYQYPLSLAANQAVIIQLTGESDYSYSDQYYVLNAYLRVYDAQHELVKEGSYYDILSVLTLSNTNNGSSNYYVEIYTEWDSGSFELHVSPNNLDNFKRMLGIEISTGSDFSQEGVAYVVEEIAYAERIRYELELKEQESIVVNFAGLDGLNTVLRIYNEDNVQLKEIYSFEGTSQALLFQADSEGNYSIEIASLQDSEEGEFELLVLPVVNVGELVLDGEVVSNELRPNQRQQYRLELEAGQIVNIRVRQIVPESDSLSLFSWSQYAFNNDTNAAQQWVSCLEYYGYVVDSAFRVNEYGISRFVLGTKIDDLCNPLRQACQLEANVKLTELGQILLYVILPGLAIILPVITVLILQNDRIWFWVIGLIVVASFVLTSSLLYVHLGTVSGISALQDFGSGIFGGTATGAAIAFMTKVLENFSERKARLLELAQAEAEAKQAKEE